MSLNKTQTVFFELLRAGLWEKEAQLSTIKDVDYCAIMQMAKEQTVVGLISAGLLHVTDIKVPKEYVLKFVGVALQLEQRNKAMNNYINCLISGLRKEGIYSLLIKGQGIAQCYERPLWRVSGDIDLLLTADNYDKAKKLLVPLATNVDKEYSYLKHIGMTINEWYVELHGTFLSRLSRHIDKEIEEIQDEIFKLGEVRAWRNGGADVFLPSADNDVLILFTHILRHYFFEGIGLRQICDWCRLLWTYRSKLEVSLIEKRLRNMGLMSEWRTFAAYAVEYLGMPAEAMPLYSNEARWSKKADRINSFVLSVGNFGHKQRRNSDNQPYLERKFISFWRRLIDMLRHFTVFPKDSIVFFVGVLRSGLFAALRGE